MNSIFVLFGIVVSIMVVVDMTLASGKIGLQSFATCRAHMDLPAKEYK